MIRKIIRISVFILIIFSVFKVKGKSSEKEKLEVVNNVNIEKYCGLWYEIARIPNSFQDKCSGKVTAEYELRKDGRLDVINKCKRENGDVNKVEGIAKIVDKETKAKLKVSFVQVLGINLFWGDYWIIGLDENYDYAVIGDPERKYGWILSKEPALHDSTRKEINQLLKNKGYDPERFESTQQ